MKQFSRRTAGFTLIELVFAGAILAIVMGFTALATHVTLMGAETTTVHAGLESKAAAVVELMTRELKDGGSKYSNFAVGSGQQSVTFARSVGCANNKPVWGNQITYSVATYGGKTCLERSEVINGTAMKQILCDKLVPTAVSVTTAQGVAVNVVGVNFQMLSDDTLTITIAIQEGNYFLHENGVVPDNIMVVTSQASVQLLNDL